MVGIIGFDTDGFAGGFETGGFSSFVKYCGLSFCKIIENTTTNNNHACKIN